MCILIGTVFRSKVLMQLLSPLLSKVDKAYDNGIQSGEDLRQWNSEWQGLMTNTMEFRVIVLLESV